MSGGFRTDAVYVVLVLLAMPCVVIAEDDATKADATPRIVVQGQLFDHVGAGVPEAKVTLTLADGTVAGSTKTDGLGDFSISSVAGLRGPAVVKIEIECYQSARIEVTLDPDKSPPFVDWEAQGDLEVEGDVSDAKTNEPVIGAEVKVRSAYRDWTGKTDDKGKFQVEELPPGRFTLEIEADKYARYRRAIELTDCSKKDVQKSAPSTQPTSSASSQSGSAKPGTEAHDGLLTILLEPERVVHLLIVDEADAPISGADVECYHKKTNDYRHLATGDDGKLAIKGFSGAMTTLLVRLNHELYVSSADFDRSIELPSDNMESSHTLVMKSAGIVVGKVVRSEDGEPLMGARVSVGDVLSDYSPRAWTGMLGEYRVTGVPPGEAVVTVHMAGRSPELKEVSVKPKQETLCDMQLAPTASLAGTISGADGKPLSNAHVAATKWRGHNTLGLQAISNKEGRFEILDVPSDSFELSVYVAGYEPLINQEVKASSSPLAFRLDKGADADGLATSGLSVGDEAPAFSFTTIDGKLLKLGDLRGKVVLLDFWATWCGPCVGEVPTLKGVFDKFGKHPDFVMISVSLDQDKAAHAAFVKARKMEWLQVLSKGAWADKTAEAYHVNAIPAVFLIGADGKIVAVDLHGTGVERAVARNLPERGE